MHAIGIGFGLSIQHPAVYPAFSVGVVEELANQTCSNLTTVVAYR